MRLLLLATALLLGKSLGALVDSGPGLFTTLKRHTSQDEAGDETNSPHSSDVVYGTWAGAAVNESNVKSVTATFVVAEATAPRNAYPYLRYDYTAWVGIDGLSDCSDGLLQAGVYVIVEKNRNVTYRAWAEWIPYSPHFFEDFVISPGDRIRATVHATNATSGTAVVENLTTWKSVKHQYVNQAKGRLCGKTAEWIIEPTIIKDSGYLANFTSLTFDDASWSSENGYRGLSAAEILDVKGLHSKVDTNCTIEGSYAVTCKFLGDFRPKE